MSAAFQIVNRPVVICRGVLSPSAGDPEQGPPGSGATITIYDSTLNHNGVGKQKTAMPWSRLVLTINSSANSAANGLVINGQEDNTNWDLISQQTYTTGAIATYDIKCGVAPNYQILYTNSAAVLTTWRMSLIGILGDRNPGA